MPVARSRRSAIKDAIVSALLHADRPLIPIRLRREIESKARLGKRTADSTWCEALQRLASEGLILDPSLAATPATNQSLIDELANDELTAGQYSEITLTNLGRLYAVILRIESYAIPKHATEAKAAVEQFLAMLVIK